MFGKVLSSFIKPHLSSRPFVCSVYQLKGKTEHYDVENFKMI